MSDRDCPAMKRRIEAGERCVRQMDERGRDVAAWETFWLELLKAYQTLCKDYASGKAMCDNGDGKPARTPVAHPLANRC